MLLHIALAVVGTWLVLAVVLGVGLGRAIARADRRRREELRTSRSVEGPDRRS